MKRMDFQKKWFLIQAFKASLGTSLAVVGYLYLNIPNGYWTVIVAAWMLSSEHVMSSAHLCLKHGFQRFFGALVGAVGGLMVLPLVHQYLVLSVPVVFLVVFLSFTVFEGRWQLKMVGTTAIIIMLISAHYQEPWDLAAYRCLAIFIGCLIALVVTACIFPFSMKGYVQQELDAVLEKQWNLLSVLFKDRVDLIDQVDFFELERKIRRLHAILKDQKHGLNQDFKQALTYGVEYILEINQSIQSVALGLSGAPLQKNCWLDKDMAHLVYHLLQSLFSLARAQVMHCDVELDQEILSDQVARFQLWYSRAQSSKRYEDMKEHYCWLSFVFSLSKLVDLCLSLNGLDFYKEEVNVKN